MYTIKVKAVLLLFGLFMFTHLQAQRHDTIKTVNIKDHIILNDGGHVQRFDSIDRAPAENGSLVDLLSQGANVQVKNYGLSNLSTLSIRGSSVAQTNVQWNGISIQNAMLGLSDLSLLPTQFFENIGIAYGDESANANEPAMGGTIFLSNRLIFSNEKKTKVGASLQYESFQNIRLGGVYSLQKKKFSFGVRLMHNQGNNIYSYYNFYRKVKEEITHAQNTQSQLLANATLKLNKQQQLQANLWFIRNKREIPPTAFETNSFKEEENKVFRAVLNHSFNKDKLAVFSTLGYTQDQFNYQDKFILLNSEAVVHNVPLHIKSTYFFNENNTLSLKLNGKYSTIVTSLKDENLQRAWSTLIYERENLFKYLNLTAHVQTEQTNLFQVPITYGASLQFNPRKEIAFYGKYGTNYRVPTLNELYYFPGGNDLLEPESSRNVEGGFKLDWKKKGLRVRNDFSAYSRQVENWIVWRGASIFFPSNIAQVWSRGLENQLKLDWNIGQTSHNSNLLYAYTLATSQKSNFVGDSSVGKQVPYIPRYSVRWNQSVTYKSILLQWQQAYTGYRFITTDESAFIEPFHLSNIFVQYTLRKKENKFSLQFRFNNMFGATYESLRGRIMPRQNFAIGFLWSKAS